VSSAYREPASPHGRRASDRLRAAALQQDAVDLVRLVRKHWQLFRAVVLVVVGAALLAALILPSVYSTSAVVMLEPRKNNVTDQSSVLSETPTDPASIQNQIQLLTSRDLAARVVDELNLADDPEFAGSSFSLNPLHWFSPPRATSGKHRDALISAFLRHISVSAVGLSTTINVTVSSRDPAKAALIADTVVKTYLDMEAAIRFDVTRKTTDWLLDRIRQLGQQVQAADAAIQRYKAENNLTDIGNSGSIVDQQLAAISAQLVTAREDLAAKQAEDERIVALVDGGHAADVSQIVSSPLIIQLREQQTDLIRQQAQFSTRYGPKHPKMIAAESQQRDLDAKIAEEVARIAGTVKNEVVVAHAQVRSLEDSLQRAENEATGQNMARVKLQSLEANAAGTRSMYESFVTRLRATQGQGAFETVDARQISHAPVPNGPSSPPRMLIAGASLPAGLLLGLLAVLLAEKFGSAAHPDMRRGTPAAARPATVEKRRPPPQVLAEMSASSLLHAAQIAADYPISPPAQTMRGLAMRIAANRPGIVAITSLDPRDGQSSFAAGLARVTSQMGLRVILLDGNLRAPAAAAQLGLVPRVGLVDVLRGAAKFSQCLQKDPRSTALLLSGAPSRTDPQAVWASAAMTRFVAHLRRVSDIVIIDAVPIVPGSELPSIAKLSDAVIVVAAAGAGLKPALDYLTASTAVPVGIVLAR
jgi:polysaccharide biosynthesis transport protein